MKKLIPMLMIALLLCSGCNLVEKAPALNRYEGSFLDVFDTVTKVVLYDTDQESAAKRVEAIHQELVQYHRLFDIYNSYDGLNNLYTVNQNAGVAPVKVDARLLELIHFSKEMYALTGGKTNIALGSVLKIWHDYREAGIEDPEHAALPPMEALEAAAALTDINDVIVDEEAGTLYLAKPGMSLDVGAIAKGYAAQMAVDSMRADGVTSLLLSVGGNVCGIGMRADGQDWKVSVQSPDMQGSLCMVHVNDQSLVTSGTYQRYYTVGGVRYHHIIDPATLMPAAYYESVSVLCPDSGLADALSTALFIMPLEDGLALISTLEGTEALWVDAQGNQTMSDGFAGYIIEESD